MIMGNGITYARATINDIDSLVYLRLALLKELGEVLSNQEENDFWAATVEYLKHAIHANDFVSYIAASNGKTVSTSGMVLFRRPPYPGNLQGLEAYILNMYTVPDYRGKGLARNLLKLCIEESKKLGAKRIWLHASEAGRHLYETMGFTMKESEMELFL